MKTTSEYLRLLKQFKDTMFTLDGVCMKLIFIGESVKNIYKKTQGTLLGNYPEVPWKDVMKQRDLIARIGKITKY